jgi:hypothetical protein
MILAPSGNSATPFWSLSSPLELAHLPSPSVRFILLHNKRSIFSRRSPMPRAPPAVSPPSTGRYQPRCPCSRVRRGLLHAVHHSIACGDLQNTGDTRSLIALTGNLACKPSPYLSPFIRRISDQCPGLIHLNESVWCNLVHPILF